MTVLRTQGVESESPLAFAALQRLLRPVMAVRDRAAGAAGARPAGGVRRGGRRRWGPVPGLPGRAEPAGGGEPSRQPVLASSTTPTGSTTRRPRPCCSWRGGWRPSGVGLLFAARDGTSGVRQRRPAGPRRRRRRRGGGRRACSPSGPASRAPQRARRAASPARAAIRWRSSSWPGRSRSDQLAGSGALPDRLPLTEGVERPSSTATAGCPRAHRRCCWSPPRTTPAGSPTVRAAAAAWGPATTGWAAVERSGLLRVHGGTLRPAASARAVGGLRAAHQHRTAAGAPCAGDRSGRRRRGPAGVAPGRLGGRAGRRRRRGARRCGGTGGARGGQRGGVGGVGTGGGAPSSRRAGPAAVPARRARPGWGRGRSGRGCSPTPRRRSRWSPSRSWPTCAAAAAHLEFHSGSLDRAHGMVLEAAAEVAPHDPARARRAGDARRRRWRVRRAVGRSAVCPIDLLPAAGPGASARERVPGRPDPGPRRGVPRGLAARLRQRLGRAIARWPASCATARDEDLLLNLGLAAWPLGDDESALRLQDRLLAHARDDRCRRHDRARADPAEPARARDRPVGGAGRRRDRGARPGGELRSAGAGRAGRLPCSALLAVPRGGGAADEHLATVERIAGEPARGRHRRWSRPGAVGARPARGGTPPGPGCTTSSRSSR